jgi:hypothetical protein
MRPGTAAVGVARVIGSAKDPEKRRLEYFKNSCVKEKYPKLSGLTVGGKTAVIYRFLNVSRGV